MTDLGLYVLRQDYFGGRRFELITGKACWQCGRPRPDLAHTVMEHVIGRVAAVLERRVHAAIAEHEAAHGCGRPGWWSSCPDVAALWDLLPDSMLPVAIG